MFIVNRIINGRLNSPETDIVPVTGQISSANVAYQCGMAISLTSGKAVPCGATTKPTHIVNENYTTTGADDTHSLSCSIVTPDVIYETAFSATPTGIAKGSVVTIASTSDKVTATATSGVATVFDMLDAAASGDRVLVRFA